MKSLKVTRIFRFFVFLIFRCFMYLGTVLPTSLHKTKKLTCKFEHLEERIFFLKNCANKHKGLISYFYTKWMSLTCIFVNLSLLFMDKNIVEFALEPYCLTCGFVFACKGIIVFPAILLTFGKSLISRKMISGNWGYKKTSVYPTGQ